VEWIIRSAIRSSRQLGKRKKGNSAFGLGRYDLLVGNAECVGPFAPDRREAICFSSKALGLVLVRANEVIE
jgi:hypothetical protein